MQTNSALQILERAIEERRLKSLRRTPKAATKKMVTAETAKKAAAYAAELAIESHKQMEAVRTIDAQIRALGYLPAATEPRFVGTSFGLPVLLPEAARARLAKLGGK